MLQLINPLVLLFTLTTAFGVLIHDTQVDRTAVAYVVPVIFAGSAMIDTSVKISEGSAHVHVKRVHGPKGYASTIRSSLPRLQPRDDDRRHIQSKRLIYSGGNDNYIWPSI